MKGKIKVLMLLSMLLLFLPVGVFAEETSAETANLADKVVSVEVEATEAPAEEPKESEATERTLEESEAATEATEVVSEELEKEPESAEPTLEESEAEKEAKEPTLEKSEIEAAEASSEEHEERTLEDKESEVIEEAESKGLAQDAETDAEELEISDIQEPEAVKSGGGGSSGGGSGCFSSGGGGFSGQGPLHRGFIIEKVNENDKPMPGVTFKITNLGTGESLVVTTKEDGKTHSIVLSQLTYMLAKSEGAGIEVPNDEIQKIIKELKDEGLLSEELKLNIYSEGQPEKGIDIENMKETSNEILVPVPVPNPPVGPGPAPDPVPIPSPQPPVDQGEGSNPNQGHEGIPKPHIIAPFMRNTSPKNFKKGTITIHIRYGNIIKESFNFNGKDGEEKYSYEDITPEQVKKIDKKLIEEFAKKRLAQKVNKGESLSAFQYVITYTNESDLYKVEEQRSEANLNYDLKTFYVRNHKDNGLTMGYSPNETNIKGEELKQQPMGPVNPEAPNPEAPNSGLPAVQSMPDFEVSEFMIPTPVGGGSSGGGGGGGVGYYGAPRFVLFKISNEPFKFETLATDGTNREGKTVEQGGRTQVIDKITFDKLSQGKEYKFVGKLINKRTGEEVKTESPIVYETGKLTSPNGEATITITFDSSIYKDGDEFVLIYDIYEDGKLAGFENNKENPAQSFKIVSTTTPPPDRETPPPKEETPPPKEETPPPKEETPPPKEETPPPLVEEPKEEVFVPEKPAEPTPVYMAPKTYDPGMGLSILTAILSGAALGFLKKRR